MIITRGRAIKKPQIAMITNKRLFPAAERFSFFSLGLKIRNFFLFVFATYSPTLPNNFCTSLFVPTISRNNTVAMAEAYPISNLVEP